MRTTITIADALYQQALEMAGLDIAKAEIFREAMKTYVRVPAAKRLAALGAAVPAMEDVPRRRPEPPACYLENNGLSPDQTPRSEGIATERQLFLANSRCQARPNAPTRGDCDEFRVEPLHL